ncbi:MAG: transcription termination factor Rho [Planctomycetes bacterium]|nr:transcription termination factor Rho [Planctomycetota bacterium]
MEDDAFGEGIDYSGARGEGLRPRRKKAAKKGVRRKVTRPARAAEPSPAGLFDDEGDEGGSEPTEAALEATPPPTAPVAPAAPSAAPAPAAPPGFAPRTPFGGPPRYASQAPSPAAPPQASAGGRPMGGPPVAQQQQQQQPGPYAHESRHPGGGHGHHGGGAQGRGGRHHPQRDAQRDSQRGGQGHGQGGPAPMHSQLPVDDEALNEAILAQTSDEPPIELVDFQRLTLRDIQIQSREMGFRDITGMKKQDLLFRLLREKTKGTRPLYGRGVVEVLPDGFGFLRSPEYSYLGCPDDVYVSPTQIRRFALKTGHQVEGLVRAPKENERYFAMLRVDKVNGRDPLDFDARQNFEDLVPLYPDQRLKLECEGGGMEMRVVDLVAPIGKGQRGVIVAPPRTGKTILLQKIANSVLKNNPEVYLIVLLIDERPEEVTDMQRTISGQRFEIVSSTFDEPALRHIQVAEMVIEKARRMVEYGEDVVILLDSITRLARAYNSEAPHSGKILTGGVDASALQRPKRFFGAARNVENGGSLTILGTALIDTGSKMDEVVFEEFKGTGNSELHLDRKLSERRVWPAIDINRSGTRKEDLLFTPEELKRVWMLRKILNEMSPVEAMELLVERMRKSRSNVEFLLSLSLA